MSEVYPKGKYYYENLQRALEKFHKRSPNWDIYRLGDCISGMWNPDNSFNGTIAKNYKDRTTENDNFDILNEVVPTISSSNEFVIHIRLGDVIENVSATVDEMWKTTTVSFGHHVFQKAHYIQPKKYWEEVVNWIPSNINNVTIVYGHHKSVDNRKSKEYLDKLEHLFTKNNIKIKYISSKDPDKDFTILCNAKYYVPTAGGFSLMAAEIVKKRGGKVFESAEDKLNLKIKNFRD